MRRGNEMPFAEGVDDDAVSPCSLSDTFLNYRLLRGPMCGVLACSIFKKIYVIIMPLSRYPELGAERNPQPFANGNA